MWRGSDVRGEEKKEETGELGSNWRPFSGESSTATSEPLDPREKDVDQVREREKDLRT